MLIDGKPKALNTPADLAEKVRERSKLPHAFMPPPQPSAESKLKRFLKEKEDRQHRQQGRPPTLTQNRFEACLDKLVSIRCWASLLRRALCRGEFPQHPWKKVVDTVFLGAAAFRRTAKNKSPVPSLYSKESVGQLRRRS